MGAVCWAIISCRNAKAWVLPKRSRSCSAWARVGRAVLDTVGPKDVCSHTAAWQTAALSRRPRCLSVGLSIHLPVRMLNGCQRRRRRELWVGLHWLWAQPPRPWNRASTQCRKTRSPSSHGSFSSSPDGGCPCMSRTGCAVSTTAWRHCRSAPCTLRPCPKHRLCRTAHPTARSRRLTTGADPGQDPTLKGGRGGALRTPKLLHGTMCFVGDGGAGDFVLGGAFTRQARAGHPF